MSKSERERGGQRISESERDLNNRHVPTEGSEMQRCVPIAR